MEISMEVPQETKTRPTYDPTLPLLGMCPKEHKSIYKKDTCIPMLIAALFIVAQQWNQLRYPTINRWIKKIWHVYYIC
jgi:hypothetical protein